MRQACCSVAVSAVRTQLKGRGKTHQICVCVYGFARLWLLLGVSNCTLPRIHTKNWGIGGGKEAEKKTRERWGRETWFGIKTFFRCRCCFRCSCFLSLTKRMVIMLQLLLGTFVCSVCARVRRGGGSREKKV